MTTAQLIARHIAALPEDAQREVFDFVKFLESKLESGDEREGDAGWSEFSLASAMRGLEEEPSPYTLADLKESFR